MKTTEKVYWIKWGVSVVVSVLSWAIQLYFKQDGSLVLLIGVLFYLSFSDFLSKTYKLERIHGLMVGIGAYLFTWVMLWTLLWTVFKF